ncbi:MAG: hypothetical protein MJ252_13745 [archaeon]|nr:hypothetical protein [archaeon]
MSSEEDNQSNEEENEVVADDEEEEDAGQVLEDDDQNSEEDENEGAVIEDKPKEKEKPKEINEPKKEEKKKEEEKEEEESENDDNIQGGDDEEEGEGEEGDNEESKQNEETKQNHEEKEEKENNDEEEDEDEEKDSQILAELKDPNVKKLFEIEINEDTKDEVIQLLLNNPILRKKEVVKVEDEEEQSEEKPIFKQTTNRYNNTISMLKSYLKGDNTENKFNKTDKFHIYSEGKDPELTKDFKTAKRQILSKLSEENKEGEEKDENEKEILRLLFGNKDPKKKEEHKKTEAQIIKGLAEKIKNALNHKKEVIDKAATAYYQDRNNKCTFAPKTNIDPNEKKRSVQEFIQNQENFRKKVLDKQKQAKMNEEAKNIKSGTKVPTIDKNSEKIFKEKLADKSEKPQSVHERLFNKKYATAKTSLLAEKEKIKKEKEKKEEKKKEKKKLPWQKKDKKKEEGKEEEGKEGEKKEEKPKEKKKSKVGYEEPKQHLLREVDLSNSKIMLNNFDNFFNKTIVEFFDTYQQVAPNETERNEEENKGEEEKKSDEEKKADEEPKKEEEKKAEESKAEEIKNEDIPAIKSVSKKEEPNLNHPPKENLVNGCLSLNQLQDVLNRLGMSSKPKFGSSIPNTETMAQQEEVKNINDLYNSLKPEDSDYISVSHLNQFLSCVLGLQNYKLYKQFKAKNIPDKDIEPKLEKNFTVDDKIDYGINLINQEMESKMDPEKSKKNKYVSYSKEDPKEILIPISKAKKIQSDFKLFAINYAEQRNKINKEKTKNRIEKKNKKDQDEMDNTFKPKISAKSNKLSQKYRDKVMSEEDNEEEGENNKDNKNDPHMIYIDKIIMKRKRFLIENMKKKEEQEEKEMEGCTFTPTINNSSTITKAHGANRFEELFKKGSEKEKSRKNRTRDDFDMEKYGSECTFTPTFEPPVEETETKFKNDIFKEKSYQLLYERLRNGKMQRELKDAVNDRYGYEHNDNLKEYIKKEKEQTIGQRTTETWKKQTIRNNQSSHEAGREENQSENKGEESMKKSQKSAEEEKKEEGSEDIDQKEGVPLLIIDVNIRAGEKKKLYVHEGDTAEALAEKFARDNSKKYFI